MAPMAGGLRACVILTCVSHYFTAATEGVFNVQTDSSASNDSAFAVFPAPGSVFADTNDAISPCVCLFNQLNP